MTSSAKALTRPLQAAVSLLVLAALIALAAGCASSRAAEPQAAMPSREATPPTAAAPAAAVAPETASKAKTPAPDDQATKSDDQGTKWKVDERGLRYKLVEVPKVEGQYTWVNKHEILMNYGLRYLVDGQTDDSFLVRSYAPRKAEPAKPAGPSPEERQAILKSYEADVPTADRLHFASFGAGLPSRGQWRNGFVLADMNGDGHLDIVHGPPRKSLSAPVVFLGDGAGHWQRWKDHFQSLPYDYGDVAVADFNGDGRLDLVLGVHLHGLIALVADGPPGNFISWSKGLDFQVTGGGVTDVGFTTRTVATADWNGDGRPDILALGEGPRLARTRQAEQGGAAPILGNETAVGFVVYLNHGDGTWSKEVGPAKKGHQAIFGDDMAVADLDGDGRPDALLATSVLGRKDLLRMDGPGGEIHIAEIPQMRPNAYSRAVAVDDFDGDGHKDLAISYLSYELDTWRTGVDIYYGQADGTWRRKPLASEEGKVTIYSLGTGDLDGDGARDLVALTGDGDAWVFLGDGHGWFVRERSDELVGAGTGCRGYEVALADLDGDGRDEIVAAYAGEPEGLLAPMRCPSQGGLKAWHLQSTAN